MDITDLVMRGRITQNEARKPEMIYASEVMKRLGIDIWHLSFDMAFLATCKAISALPKEEQVAAATAVFGDAS